ncbi:MAG: ATP-binding protein, partial [Pseudomonadota bacterium]
PTAGPKSGVGVVFCVAVLVIGISVWMFILVRESHVSAVEQADLQTQRLLREVRAHERTDRQLQQAKERAEAANLAKTRYLTGLSHELRTPLNSIFGFAQILEADPEIPERRRDAVLTIRRASEHLAGLIEGLLDISKIEAGRLDIHRNRINLPAFLDQIASIFEEQARQKGLRFNMVREGMIPTWIMFDEKRLRQIIINLLSNAIRYTDSGEVHLRVAYRNEIATIEAVDTGRGIKPDDLEKIWKPFERGGVEDINGTGLGLTITKLLVEILGGDIEVETCVGEGSRFRVRLMLPSVPETAMMEEPSQAKTARGAVTGYAGRRRKILVVDDDLNHLSLVEGYFAPLGFQVLLARSCGAAELILRDATPDIFILDIDLPSSSGWELATSLRRNGHRATPIIMISGHALEARTRGPEDVLHDAFVAKPYNLADLLQRIATLLQLQLEYSTDEEAQGSSAAAVLSKKDLERILVSARIGHASGLSDVLADVKARPGAAPAELAEIERMLGTYDLRGIEERVVRWLAT